jgi:hypothetical protein
VSAGQYITSQSPVTRRWYVISPTGHVKGSRGYTERGTAQAWADFYSDPDAPWPVSAPRTYADAEKRLHHPEANRAGDPYDYLQHPFVNPAQEVTS